MEKEFYCNTHIRIKEKGTEAEGYFGRGVADLLHGIETHQSLNLSAKQMGMAYSKAWRIMRQAEEVLGMELLYRMGKRGSRLTPEGERFLKAYEEAAQEASKAVYQIFEKYYGNAYDAPAR